MAEWTGLEPATPGVTGRYSNQLNYHSKTLLVDTDGIKPLTFALQGTNYKAISHLAAIELSNDLN